MAEKKCPKCAMMIPAEAKFCPHCRKRIGMSPLTKLVLFIIGLMLLMSYLEKSEYIPDFLLPSPTVKEEIKKETKEYVEEIISLKTGKAIKLGMTDTQVINLWGHPNKINASVGKWGRNEQWVYRNEYLGNQHLYFRNDVLKSWQDF